MVKKGEVFGNSPCSKCFLWLFIFSIIIFVLQAIFVFTPIFHNDFYLHDVLGNIFIVALSFLALISTIKIYNLIPSNFPREKKGKFFLIISIVLFFIGDVLWLVSEVFFGNLVPIGGAPDFSWNLAYIFLIISILYFISIGFRSSKKFLYVILILGVLVGGTVLYFDVAEDFEQGSFTFAHSLQDAYILYDFVVLLLIIYLVWPILGFGVSFGLHWILIGVGVFTRLIYDQIFVRMLENNSYYTGHPVDLLYVSFYVFLVLAFYFKSKELRSIKND